MVDFERLVEKCKTVSGEKEVTEILLLKCKRYIIKVNDRYITSRKKYDYIKYLADKLSEHFSCKVVEQVIVYDHVSDWSDIFKLCNTYMINKLRSKHPHLQRYFIQDVINENILRFLKYYSGSYIAEKQHVEHVLKFINSFKSCFDLDELTDVQMKKICFFTYIYDQGLNNSYKKVLLIKNKKITYTNMVCMKGSQCTKSLEAISETNDNLRHIEQRFNELDNEWINDFVRYLNATSNANLIVKFRQFMNDNFNADLIKEDILKLQVIINSYWQDRFGHNYTSI